MRKDRQELQINRQLRRRPLLDQIRPHGLALQLRILLISESMGHHDSEIMDDRGIDRDDA
jgi:hypothetical protein